MAAFTVARVVFDRLLNGEPALGVVFHVDVGDAKAGVAPFTVDITVPRDSTLDRTMDRAGRALHRVSSRLSEETSGPIDWTSLPARTSPD